jgi:hypothetical protein
VTRRGFLFLLAAPLLAGAAGCGGGRALRAALAGFFADRSSARVVGAEYLRLFPDEDDDTRLVRRLAGGKRRELEWESLAVADVAALRERVRERHHDDFAAGRTVDLRGWVLSETEVRLCALAARSA